jgi:hypothetical protein
MLDKLSNQWNDIFGNENAGFEALSPISVTAEYYCLYLLVEFILSQYIFASFKYFLLQEYDCDSAFDDKLYFL